MSSSPALDDGEVLRAFTAAYNDKFHKLMSSAASPSAPACSACAASSMSEAAATPRTAIIEIIKQQRVVPPASSKPGKSSEGSIWIWVGVFFVVGLIFFWIAMKNKWASGGSCKSKKLTDMYGGHGIVSVESELLANAGGGAPSSSAVQEIADPSQAIPSKDNCIVMYHATWCGHCKQMRPLFDKEAASRKGSCSFFACEHEVLEKAPRAKELGIQGYPTIIAFKSGSKQGELVGGVPADKLKAFLDKHSR